MPREAIDQAAVALEAGDRLAALDALLAAWRACRAPELEEVIDIVSADAARSRPDLDEDSDAYDTEWNELARAELSVDIESLLPGLWTSPKGSIPLRARSLLSRDADPRIGRGLLEMIKEPPMTASSAFSTWTLVFNALPTCADQRAVRMLRRRAKKHDGKSQFWPKLTRWIGTTIDELPEPAELPRGTKTRVKKLRSAARRLAKEPPGEIDVSQQRATTVSAADALSAALACVEDEQLEPALEALLAFWAERRSRAVAELIDRIGVLLNENHERLDSGKAKAIHQRWMALADEPSAADVGRLLDSVRAGRLIDIEERLSAMTRWAPDPRVPATMFRFIDDSSIGGRPLLWRLVYEVFLVHADARLRDRFAARRAWIGERPGYDRVAAERAGMNRVAESIVEALALETPLAAAENHLVRAIDAKLDAIDAKRESAGAADEQIIAGFIDAIVSDPAADGPRLVFADWLLEQGDPLGNYITLSIALANGKRVRGKTEKLFKKHQRHIRGPLDPLLYQCEHERGFLKSAWLDTGRGAFDQPAARIDAMLEDWRWSTIESLKAWDEAGLEKILTRAPLRSLRELRDVSLSLLLEITSPLPIERVTLGWSEDEVLWPSLDKTTRQFLPRLRELTWRRGDQPPSELFRSVLGRQLEMLRSEGGTTLTVDQWAGLLRDTECPIPEVVVRRNPGTATFGSPEDGARPLTLQIRCVRFENPQGQALLAALRGIPDGTVSSTTCGILLASDHEQYPLLIDALSHLSPTIVPFDAG